MENIEMFIKNNIVRLKRPSRTIEIAPDISDETRKRWIKKYGKSDTELIDRFIFVSDTNVGSIGVTGKGIYFDNFLQKGKQYIGFEDISYTKAIEGGIFRSDKVEIFTNKGTVLTLDGAIDGINVDLFSSMVNQIIETARKNNLVFRSSKQNVVLSEVPDRLKLIYLEILCNYAYLNDELIDAYEYSAIGNFIVRMELVEKERGMLREYMNNISDRYKTGTLLNFAKKNLQEETGQWDAWRYSLMQDILFLFDIQSPNDPWRNDGFIGSLTEHTGLRPAQVDTMSSAVRLNKKMQQKGWDYQEVRKEWQDLLQKSSFTEGHVPSLYLFCSGSVYGVGCYRDFFARDDDSQKAINKKREVILHEIIGNTQKTINLLADDMNYIATLLEDAIEESEKCKKQYKELIDRLKNAQEALRRRTE